MKISEKYMKTKEELQLMNEKQKKKYFNKKKRYIAIKSIGDPQKALPEFHKLMDEMLYCDYITQEQYDNSMNEISEHIISFSEMSTDDIKTQVTQSVKEIFGKR